MPNPGSSMSSQRTEKEKQCPYCPRTFTKKEHLTRHRRSHTGEKPFHCHKCGRKYSRSDVLARHLQTHSPENLAPPLPPGYSDPTADLQHTSAHSSLLPAISTFITAASFPRAESQQVQALTSSDNHATLHSATSDMWSHARHDGSNEVIQQDIPILPPLPEVSTEDEDVSRLEMTASEREIHAAVDRASAVHTAEPQFSFQLMMHDQEQLAPQIGGGEVRQQISGQNLYTIPLQSTAAQHDVRLPSLPESLGTGRCDETDPFRIEANFGVCGYLSPGMMDMDYLDYATPQTPLSMPRLHEDRSDNTQILLSVERLQQIQRLWRGKRSAPGVRLIRFLWGKVIRHEPDNIFSKPTASIPSRLEPMLGGVQTLRLGVGVECRKELIDFCTELDSRIQREGLADLTPHSTPPQRHSESVFESPPPGFSVDGFPAKEALDASVDFFFQYFPMPFVHKATFDAKTTPASLLFPMCLVGLAALYPESSKPFVLRYQKKLMRFCRSELTSIALGHCQPGEFLVLIASTLLVAYLGLGLWDDEAEERQSHMLCVQMLHITEKHGLFAAYLGDDLALQLQIAPGNDESSWKTWARVESTKRMILYLVWIDAAYARLMGSAGVVDMDKVELYLPCQTVLFEATTFPKFQQAAKRGAQLVQTRIQVQNLQATAPSTIDHLSMETLLSSLYLQTAAARNGLRGGSNMISEAQTCSPAEVLARDFKGEKIILSILLLPRKYATIFQSKNTMISLAWNNLCIALTADLDLLEVASGRDGVASAHTAIAAVVKWSRSANARRAILHATQIFDILSSSRLHGSTFARPDLLLFVSALVLSMYLLVVEPGEEDQNTQVFELLQDVDWATVDGEGMLHPPAENNLSTSRLDYQHPPDLADNAAGEFIRHGGPVSFAGEDQLGGATAARKILLNYMHLLDDLGKWRGSRYSQLLRTMSDFVTEGNC